MLLCPRAAFLSVMAPSDDQAAALAALEAEMAERKDHLRRTYTAAARALRERIELRAHRLPRELRDVRLRDLPAAAAARSAGSEA
ncbi:uncharacterized protein V1510DRAFT_419431 [Dipodascopsis tothii]|uniref:uncharacterized protein n=1 Tax=Dipodascopsis tothii TaxID=44089 RepID=UPI0034CDF376